MINEGLPEGDILRRDPTDRNAVPHDNRWWPDATVIYAIDPSLNQWRKEIQDAMDHIEQNSCIKFKERQPNDLHYVRIHYGPGCFASIGYMQNGEQDLSLGPECHYRGIIIHEIMHTLGFEHEFTRVDRDKYIIVKYENVKENYKEMFDLKHWRTFGIRFDYESIMMYGKGTGLSFDGRTETMSFQRWEDSKWTRIKGYVISLGR